MTRLISTGSSLVNCDHIREIIEGRDHATVVWSNGDEQKMTPREIEKLILANAIDEWMKHPMTAAEATTDRAEAGVEP